VNPLVGEHVQEHLRLALRTMLKPLIRLLISQGVSHADFSEAAKDVYVEMAIRHFDDSEKVNQSRVAILTGLTRKEVKNVIDRAMTTTSHGKNFSRPSRVLVGWHSDPKYTGPYGVPLEIPYESTLKDQPSFKELVRAYSGDMAPLQMLKELIRVGAVVQLDNGNYKVLRRNFEPERLSPELLERFGDVAHNFFSTAAANIEKSEQGAGFFERVVYAEEPITKEIIAQFDLYVKTRGQEFLEELDNWFVRKQEEADNKQERFDTGFGMFHYVESKEDKQSLRGLLVERGLDSDKEPDF
jgi:hypothetical protein